MFGKRLADERGRLGLSQKALADAWGLGRSAVAMIETGRSALDVDRVIALASLGFDISYLLSGVRGKQAAGSLLDWDLLAKVLQGVRKWSSSHGLDLPIEKEVLILKVLYERFARDGVVDDRKIEETLRIAA